MWNTSLRDVTCCFHILGIPPHQGADAVRLSTHCRYNPDSMPQKRRPSPSAGAPTPLVGGELGGWPGGLGVSHKMG